MFNMIRLREKCVESRRMSIWIGGERGEELSESVMYEPRLCLIWFSSERSVMSLGV